MKSIPSGPALILVSGLLASCSEAPAPRVPAPPTASNAPSAPPPAQGTASFAAALGQEAPSDVDDPVVSSSTDDPATARCGGVTFAKPATWVWITPTMQFRTLQYSVPGTEGDAAADLIFSVFPPGGAGPVGPNLDRWQNQFRSTEGIPARSERSTFEVAGSKVSFIELEGSYAGMGAAAPRSGWAQLGAIIEAPTSSIFVRLLGPSGTVLSNLDAFKDMIKSMSID